MHISQSNQMKMYLMDNQPIEVTEQEKDIGELINSNLKFSDQVASVVKKTNKIVCLVKRSIKYIDKEVYIRA